MPIKVRCRCGKGLKVRDSAAGKRVKCPECGKPVQIPEPVYDDELVDDDYGDDPYGSDDYGPDDGYAPAPRRKKTTSAKKNRKSAASTSKLPLIIVGGVAVGVLVIGSVLYAVFSGGDTGSDNFTEVAGTSPEIAAPTAATASTTPAAQTTSVASGGHSADGHAAASPGGDASHAAAAAPQTTPTAPANPPPGGSVTASGGPDNFWVVLSDFKEQSDPQNIGKTYQVNYRVVAGSPNPSKRYVIYLGASMGVLERYNEVPIDLQASGTVHIPAGIGISGQVRAYVAEKRGRQEWEPVSGEITVGGPPTTAQRPPTVVEAAGAAAQGKLIALANARFELSRMKTNALVVDYVLQQSLQPAGRYFLVVQGQGTPVQTDVTIQLGRARVGEKDQMGVSLLPGRDFPAGSLTAHIESRKSIIRRDDAEIVSNSVSVKR